MAWRDELTFGNCLCGGGPFTARSVAAHFEHRDLTLEGVAQAYCSNCGSRSYPATGLELLECVQLGQPMPPPREVW